MHATRPRGSRRSGGPALLVATVIAALGLLAPITPAAADPVASTVGVSYGSADPVHGIHLYLTVSTGGPVATGDVTVTEGSTELVRATLRNGATQVDLDAPTLGRRTLTVSYLGSSDVSGSSTTSTVTVQSYPVDRPLTGTVTVGSLSAPVGPASNLSYYPYLLYDPLTGSLTANGMFTASSVTADVPGFGPVTVDFLPGFSSIKGTLASDGSASLSTPVSFLRVLRIHVGGVTWAAGTSCFGPSLPLTLTGTGTASALTLSGTTSQPFVVSPTATCDGRAALVASVLSGPVSYDLVSAGAFPPPPPQMQTTATSVSVADPTPVGGDALTVRATVTASEGTTPQGQVRFTGAGANPQVATLIGGVATAKLAVATLGAGTVTADYLGYATTFLPSSGTVPITVTPPPDGRPATGQIAVGTNPATTFPAGTRLVGADFDPLTGDIGSGYLWFPADVMQVDTGIIGMVTVQYRLTQTTPVTGHVAGDGSVTFDPTGLVLEARAYGGSGSWTTLTDCAYGPISLALSGTADAGGLHLRAAHATVPPLPSNACSGLAFFINPRVAVGTDVSVDVQGDFRRFAPSTAVDVATYFPSVAQHNQSYFVAHVGTGTDIPTGEVTFRDGAVVLGTAPVDSTGHASLVASMDEAGTRTVTAAFDGDALHGPGSDTTTVEVSPAPTGLTLDGSLSVSGQDLGIGAGSRLVPASGTDGSALPR